MKTMGRLSLGLGFGAGYVLGARAGRARFEQIRQAATSCTERPEVQQALEKVKGAAPGPLQGALGALSRRGSGTTAGTVGLPPEVDAESAVTTSTGSAIPPEPRGATDLPAGGPETP